MHMSSAAGAPIGSALLEALLKTWHVILTDLHIVSVSCRSGSCPLIEQPACLALLHPCCGQLERKTLALAIMPYRAQRRRVHQHLHQHYGARPAQQVLCKAAHQLPLLQTRASEQPGRVPMRQAWACLSGLEACGARCTLQHPGACLPGPHTLAASPGRLSKY